MWYQRCQFCGYTRGLERGLLIAWCQGEPCAIIPPSSQSVSATDLTLLQEAYPMKHQQRGCLVLPSNQRSPVERPRPWPSHSFYVLNVSFFRYRAQEFKTPTCMDRKVPRCSQRLDYQTRGSNNLDYCQSIRPGSTKRRMCCSG